MERHFKAVWDFEPVWVYFGYHVNVLLLFNSSRFFFTNEIFLLNDIFLYKLKTLLEACFLWRNSYISTDLLNKQNQQFADVLQNRFLKNFTIITVKHLCWSLFLIKLQTWSLAPLLKRNSSTGVSLWILQNF